jgi:hypothetical protein
MPKRRRLLQRIPIFPWRPAPAVQGAELEAHGVRMA